MYRFWKPEEISELKLLYSNTPNAELSARYNRTVRAIYATANNLGLRKSKEFIVNTAREISSRPNHGGEKTRFKPGQKPWNTGTKGVCKVNSGCFQKGSIPHNYREIGSEIVQADGYVYVKTESGIVLKHRLVWEHANGPIPRGFNIRFKDGNTRNCELSNLYMISNADNMKKNSMHNYPPELQKVIYTIKSLNHHIKKQNQHEKDES